MKRIEQVVLSIVSEIGDEQENNELKSPELTTVLFGENLDSMGIVLLVTELEEAISDEFDMQISLADERAMSQKTSPFRNVKTLIKYVDTLVSEYKSET